MTPKTWRGAATKATVGHQQHVGDIDLLVEVHDADDDDPQLLGEIVQRAEHGADVGDAIAVDLAEAEISFFGVKGVSIPVAVSVFPDELYPTSRSWAERAYPKLIYYNKLAKG